MKKNEVLIHAATWKHFKAIKADQKPTYWPTPVIKTSRIDRWSEPFLTALRRQRQENQELHIYIVTHRCLLDWLSTRTFTEPHALTSRGRFLLQPKTQPTGGCLERGRAVCGGNGVGLANSGEPGVSLSVGPLDSEHAQCFGSTLLVI